MIDLILPGDAEKMAVPIWRLTLYSDAICSDAIQKTDFDCIYTEKMAYTEKYEFALIIKCGSWLNCNERYYFYSQPQYAGKTC